MCKIGYQTELTNEEGNTDNDSIQDNTVQICVWPIAAAVAYW